MPDLVPAYNVLFAARSCGDLAQEAYCGVVV